VRSTPLRISAPSAATCRPSIWKRGTVIRSILLPLPA
jgi:hypothetical protein